MGFSVFLFMFSVPFFHIVFAPLGSFLDWPVLIVAYSPVLALKSIYIGVTADVGLTEMAVTTLFGGFGVPLSGGATVLIRIITVWLTFPIGLAAAQWVGLETVLATETFQK